MIFRMSFYSMCLYGWARDVRGFVAMYVYGHLPRGEGFNYLSLFYPYMCLHPWETVSLCGHSFWWVLAFGATPVFATSLRTKLLDPVLLNPQTKLLDDIHRVHSTKTLCALRLLFLNLVFSTEVLLYCFVWWTESASEEQQCEQDPGGQGLRGRTHHTHSPPYKHTNMRRALGCFPIQYR